HLSRINTWGTNHGSGRIPSGGETRKTVQSQACRAIFCRLYRPPAFSVSGLSAPVSTVPSTNRARRSTPAPPASAPRPASPPGRARSALPALTDEDREAPDDAGVEAPDDVVIEAPHDAVGIEAPDDAVV